MLSQAQVAQNTFTSIRYYGITGIPLNSNMCSTGDVQTIAHRPRPAALVTSVQEVPVATTHIAAGFPSPAQDYDHESLDLNTHLIRDRVSTYILRVGGDSMVDAGIADGDEIIVDRGLTPGNGDVVVAVINGEFTVKRFLDAGGHGVLRPENPAYPDIPIGPDSDFMIWGVVTRCLHKLR